MSIWLRMHYHITTLLLGFISKLAKRKKDACTRNFAFRRGGGQPCLVPHPKFFHPSHRIFGHMHRTLNVDKKIN